MDIFKKKQLTKRSLYVILGSLNYLKNDLDSVCQSLERELNDRDLHLNPVTRSSKTEELESRRAFYVDLSDALEEFESIYCSKGE